jgi:hypothetical protein
MSDHLAAVAGPEPERELPSGVAPKMRQDTPSPRPRWAQLCAVAACATCLLLSRTGATQTTLAAEPLVGVKVRLDGVPREWPGRSLVLDQVLSGNPNGRKISARIGYDELFLYVTMDAEDAELVRSRSASAKDDHATLYLAFPLTKGGYSTHVLQLFPGKPGSAPGLVKTKGGPVRGAQLVEAPHSDGFTFEARIPWSHFGEAKRTRVGLRAAITYSDTSGGKLAAVVGTSRAKAGSALPPLPFESEQALLHTLVRNKGLAPSPTRAVYGNVFGGPMYEQVAVWGSFLSIVGPEYRAGKEFYFSDLGSAERAKVVRLELIDFDGDGKREILLQKRLGSSIRYREWVQVLKLGEDGVPAVVFEHDVASESEEHSVKNVVTVSSTAGKRELKISQAKSARVNQERWSELPSQENGLLLPWDDLKSRTFALRGARFVEVDADRAVATSKAPKKAASSGNALATASSPASSEAPPRAPSTEELLDRVYALYRRDRGVGQKRPRFDFVANVAEDARPERVLVHGKDLVVFGKGYLEGSSYAYMTIGVAEAEDILSVTARDVTGDGLAEIVVQALIRSKASEALGGDTVMRKVEFLYKVTGNRLTRIFAAEILRAVGKQEIVSQVVYNAKGKRGYLELRPGKAKGWTPATYPFPEDQSPAGGLEPLLLPWSKATAKAYRFDGERFVMER